MLVHQRVSGVVSQLQVVSWGVSRGEYLGIQLKIRSFRSSQDLKAPKVQLSHPNPYWDRENTKTNSLPFFLFWRGWTSINTSYFWCEHLGIKSLEHLLFRCEELLELRLKSDERRAELGVQEVPGSKRNSTQSDAALKMGTLWQSNIASWDNWELTELNEGFFIAIGFVPDHISLSAGHWKGQDRGGRCQRLTAFQNFFASTLTGRNTRHTSISW